MMRRAQFSAPSRIYQTACTQRTVEGSFVSQEMWGVRGNALAHQPPGITNRIQGKTVMTLLISLQEILQNYRRRKRQAQGVRRIHTVFR